VDSFKYIASNGALPGISWKVMCVCASIKPGITPFFGKINDLSVFWNGNAGANSGDFAVFNEDDLILADGAFGGIKQIPGAGWR